MSLALFFGVLVLLLVLTVPICVSFAFVTLLPSIVDASFPYTADAAVRSMVSGLNNFPLLAIPLFIIAGVIMAKGQISERLFNVFSYFVGNRTAGLPCAVTITCLFYGAISGSGPATTAAVAFARVITLMNVATIVSEAVLSAISSKVVILLLINVLLLFVGMIMDTGPAILVFTPVLLPVAEAIGVDPIHFGIIMCVNLAIGFVTPPMGANLFVASNLSKVSVFDIARKAVPFILAFLIALLLITFVPQISMFLLQ